MFNILETISKNEASVNSSINVAFILVITFAIVTSVIWTSIKIKKSNIKPKEKNEIYNHPYDIIEDDYIPKKKI